MPKAPSKDLFYLIKSLSTPEKIYLKSGNNKIKGESPEYLEIFNLIDAQDNYNESEITQKLNITGLNAFAKQKGYLYNLLLKKLEEFNSGSSKETEVYHLMIQVNILYGKSLFSQAEKLLERVRTLVNENEILQIKQAVLFGELQILRAKQEYYKIDSEQFKNNIENAAKQSSNHLLYFLYGMQAEYLSQCFYTSRSPEHVKKIVYYLATPYFSGQGNALSKRAKRVYYAIKSKLLSMADDTKGAYMVMCEYVGFLHKGIVQNQLSGLSYYFVAVHNKITLELSQKKYAEASKNLKQFKIYLEKYRKQLSDYILHESYIMYYTSYLEFYNIKGEFGKSILFIEKIKSVNHIKQIKISDVILLKFVFAVAFFGARDFQTSNKYLSEILNISRTNELRSDIIGIAKIFQLILYFEMGEDDFLHSAIRSTYRFLLKEQKLYKTEDIILKFIRNKLPKTNSYKERIEIFKELKAELSEITKDAHEAKVFEYFNFIAWVESKIENRDFADIVREKAM